MHGCGHLFIHSFVNMVGLVLHNSGPLLGILGPLKEYWCRPPPLDLSKINFTPLFFLDCMHYISFFSLFFCFSMFLTVPDAMHPICKFFSINHSAKSHWVLLCKNQAPGATHPNSHYQCHSSRETASLFYCMRTTKM